MLFILNEQKIKTSAHVMKIERIVRGQQIRYFRALYVFFNFECSSHNFNNDIRNLSFNQLQNIYASTVSLFLYALL